MTDSTSNSAGADDQGSVTYSDSLVTFLDLLGFGDLVEKEPDANKISEVLNTLRDEAGERPDLAEFMELKQLFFSDSVIRVRQSGGCDGITSPGLQHELLMLAHSQARLIDKEIVVRGGITFGKVFLSDDRVFGPAHQKAYRLESKAALHPRIVVDSELLERFVGYPEGGGNLEFADAYGEVYGLLFKDDDGEWFLDYLRTMSSEFDHYEDYWDFLERHKELIIMRLAEYQDSERILAKYRWLGNYHNAVIDEFSPNTFSASHHSAGSLRVTTVDEEPYDGE
jgi:hypothetical protein